MKRKKLSCIALLLLMFFAFGIAAESVALAAPIGEWKFDEGSGTTAYDSSGKGKTGTITGATWIDGLLNKALKFAGSTNYVKVPQSLDGLSNWSFTAYIKPTGTGEVKIYSEKDDKNNFYFYISITADDRIKVGTWHGERPGWDIYQTAANQIKRNEWSHLCVTLENGGATAGSGTVKCYVNRTLVEPTGRLGSCQAAVPVTGVSLNKTSISLAAGATETLTATVSPANATNKNVTWSSSNTAVATVSNGTVTAKAAGTATITVRTADGGKTATCTVTVPHVVGASWTVGPNTTLTRLGNAVGKSPGADFDNIYPWSQMQPQTISTNDGDKTVVKIPKFYYQRTYDEDNKVHEFRIANAPLADFKVHPAFVRPDGVKDYVLVGAERFGGGARKDNRPTAEKCGPGWGLIDIQTWSAIQMLWLVEYADTNSENFSAIYRGINLPGNYPDYIDGINIYDRRVYISNNNSGYEDDVYSGDYKDTGFVLPNLSYITNWHYSPAYDWLFLPSEGGGGENSYIPDYVWSYTGSRVACAGGYYFGSISRSYGLFCWDCARHSTQRGSSGVRTRLLYIP